MRSVKRTYVGIMHAVAKFGPVASLAGNTSLGEAYGWRRWVASLFAIHDTDKMVALDLPWWNVAATREAERFLAAHPHARVFEYGAGASTAWLAKRANAVISVEHDGEWHKRIEPLVATRPNASVWHRDLAGDDYVGAIDEAGGKFDLIVIDGRRRIECLTRAIPHLKAGGIILFDDTGRSRYRDGIKRCGLRERRHFGLSYCVPYPDFTSILYD